MRNCKSNIISLKLSIRTKRFVTRKKSKFSSSTMTNKYNLCTINLEPRRKLVSLIIENTRKPQPISKRKQIFLYLGSITDQITSLGAPKLGVLKRSNFLLRIDDGKVQRENGRNAKRNHIAQAKSKHRVISAPRAKCMLNGYRTRKIPQQGPSQNTQGRKTPRRTV